MGSPPASNDLFSLVLRAPYSILHTLYSVETTASGGGFEDWISVEREGRDNTVRDIGL